MVKITCIALLMIIQAISANAQLNLSPVNTGDCVTARIDAKRTAYMDEYYKKYCAQNKDKEKEKKCLENTKTNIHFSFFTDRCSESDYFIGVNGKEVPLKKQPGKAVKPHTFMGSYVGKGMQVVINNPRLIKKTYMAGEASIESNVEDAAYKVDVTVKRRASTKTFRDMVLWYGL